MDGQSVPGWLSFGAGRGLLCSPRLSRLGGSAAARLSGQPGALAAGGHPRQGRAALPRPPARSLKLEGRLLRTWPQRTSSDSAEQGRGHFQEKEQGVPTSLCYKGPGPRISWVKDRGRDLAPSATTSSLPSWGQVLQQGQCPGQLCPALLSCCQSSPLGSGRFHLEQMQLPWLWVWSRQSQIQGCYPRVTGSLQSPCLGCILHSCWLLLAPGSSPEQILC